MDEHSNHGGEVALAERSAPAVASGRGTAHVAELSAGQPSRSGVKTAARVAGLTVAAISALLAIGSVLQLARLVPGIDFYQFWVVGTELRYGQPHDVYSEQQRVELGRKWRDLADTAGERQLTAARVRSSLQTFSSPALYSVFAALSSGDYERDHFRYCLVCLATSVAGIVTLCRVFGYSWTRSLLAVTLFVGCSAPLRSDIIVTNVNQLQFGGLALYLWGQSRAEWRLRHLFCGAVLGVLLAFKPNLGLCAAFLFLTWGANRRWSKLGQSLLGMSVALAATFAASARVFGSADCWQEWLSSLRELLVEVSSSSKMGNYAPANLIEELSGRRVSTALLAILGAIAAVVIVRAHRKTAGDDARRPLDEDALAISLGVSVMLLSSALVWLHYLVLLVPTAIYCLRPDGARGRHWHSLLQSTTAWIATVLIIQFPPVMGFVLSAIRTLGMPGPVAKTALIGLGTLTLFLLAVREIQARPVVSRTTPPNSPGILKPQGVAYNIEGGIRAL